ncbi:hypothetical protein J9303_19920 [Bacillaceae bacterium Marseille-Q3522]|nr:hypothetical protein [Bacillaceae bacterium Marseille-Q3522]
MNVVTKQRTFIILFFALLFLLIVATVWFIGRGKDIPDRGEDPGKLKAEQFIYEYVNTLNKNNYEELKNLLGTPSSDTDIKERIQKYGGRDFTNVKAIVVQEFPYVYQVWIQALDGTGAKIEMYEVIEWGGKRWSIAGLQKEPPPSL